jgi:hypothetical protein
MPFRFFVKYFCTRSSVSISLEKWGDHMGELYSSIGLTKVQNNLLCSERSLVLKHFSSILTRANPFAAILWQWAEKSSFVSKITPKSEVVVTFNSLMPDKV